MKHIASPLLSHAPLCNSRSRRSRRQRFVRRRVKLSQTTRVLATKLLAAKLLATTVLIASTGCSDRPVADDFEVPIESQLNDAYQEHLLASADESSPRAVVLRNVVVPGDKSESVTPASSTRPTATSSGPQVRTRLASFANRRRIKWSFGGLNPDGASDIPSGTQLAQVQIESIPTPEPSTGQTIEVIPTPKGEPISKQRSSKGDGDPVARIAADVEKSQQGESGSQVEMAAAGKTAPQRPALIDPTTEPGLVAGGDGPEDYQQWPAPDAVLFVTGNQHGYIEPCGCTGLDKQKGGVARRFTFMDQLRQQGWNLVPIDAGNQIRRIGRQAAIKFEKSSSALKQMKYQAVGFGPSDMRLSPADLIAITYADTPQDAMYVAGNVVIFDRSLIPTHKVVRQGEWNIGLTSILDPDALEAPPGSDVTVSPTKESAEKVLAEMNAAGANFRVLTYFGEEEAAKKLMVDVPGYDLIVVSGGFGEPTYRPQDIEGSKTKLIVTGNKGMYAGLVGLYQGQSMRYARVPLTHEFEDAPEMRQLMRDYQLQLEQLGLEELGISPIPHPSKDKYVGSEACGKCHTEAYKIWKNTPHFHATDHIVKPPKERGDIARHHDPECISCHVTGWHPQNYYPYESGYLSLTKTPLLTGSGCENCHGPGAKHSAAEQPGSGVKDDELERLREAMQLPYDDAKEHCMKCHDLDNSPDFHDEGAFEDTYWPKVEHYGVD